ncbi:unnamed protein product, partial [Nesidiocoris tenuis]
YVKGPRAGPGPLGPRAPGILPPLPPLWTALGNPEDKLQPCKLMPVAVCVPRFLRLLDCDSKSAYKTTTLPPYVSYCSQFYHRQHMNAYGH